MKPATKAGPLSRDAIVLSGWTWDAFNVPERVALALAHLGARVLYCENPRSFFRSKEEPLTEVHPGIYRLVTRFVGHRLNHLPYAAEPQARILARQILQSASALELKAPLFIYPHGDFFPPLCRQFKQTGFPLIHVCLDYPEPGQERLIELSDLTLVVPKSVFHQLKAKFGAKVALIPQVRPGTSNGTQYPASKLPPEFSTIPRPRLGYIGAASDRLNLRVLEAILTSRPEWHFVHFGETKCLPLPNVHVLSWRHPSELREVISHLDAGLMPYDCHSHKNFHCMPLKVFDYFMAGIPVVSTPIVNLWEYSDIVYFGDDGLDLVRTIERALQEPADSPRKTARVEIAKQNSIEALANTLLGVLPPVGMSSHVPSD